MEGLVDLARGAEDRQVGAAREVAAAHRQVAHRRRARNQRAGPRAEDQQALLVVREQVELRMSSRMPFHASAK